VFSLYRQNGEGYKGEYRSWQNKKVKEKGFQAKRSEAL